VTHVLKKSREIHFQRCRRDGVPKAHVDLHVNAGLGEMCLHNGAESAVAIVFPDRMDLQCVHVERQPVIVDFRCCNLADCRVNRCLGWLAHAEKIEVSCRSVALADADRKEQRAFQDELFPVSRLGQAIQEAFGRVVHERQREVLATLL